MAYYVGDIPAEDLVIEPARNDQPIELDPFVEGDTEVTLRTFEGEVVEADFLVTFDSSDPDDVDRLILEWPATTVFETPGLYTLTVALVNDSPGSEARETLSPVYLVAQESNGWHTLDSARQEWGDAEALSDLNLFRLLELSRQQITVYGPTLAEGAPVPENYKRAQLMQARNLLNAIRVDPASGNTGEDTFSLTPYPLDWVIKQVVRPLSAVPVVG